MRRAWFYFIEGVPIVKESFNWAELTFGRTLLVNKAGLENAKNLVAGYKQGKIKEMNEELWKAKKIVDSTLHPGRCCRIAFDCGC